MEKDRGWARGEHPGRNSHISKGPEAGKGASVLSWEGDETSGNVRNVPAGDGPWFGGYNLVLAASGSAGMKATPQWQPSCCFPSPIGQLL